MGLDEVEDAAWGMAAPQAGGVVAREELDGVFGDSGEPGHYGRHAGLGADDVLEPVELDGGIAAFLGDRTFAAMTGRDRAGRLWLSPFTGRPRATPNVSPSRTCPTAPGEIETCTSSGETASSSSSPASGNTSRTTPLWGFRENRIAVRFQYKWQNGTGQWWRSYGNELWEFAPNGLMSRREASIKDRPISESERRIFGPSPESEHGIDFPIW
jgi:Protein of unknown function (DUF1348)